MSDAVANPKPRLVFLDVVRGFAALAVLLQHTSEVVSRGYLSWSFRWMNFGRMGVAAFFLVSGFVIPYSLERANSLRVFWVSRFFRLYPLFWFSLLMVVTFHLSGDHRLTEGYDSHWARVVLFNITMFQEFLGQPHAIGLYWTLTLEMVFYIAFSALFAMGLNKRSLLWAWVGLAVMVAAAAVDRNGIEHGAHYKLPIARIALLVYALIGTAVFRYYSGQISGRQIGMLGVGAAIAFAIAMRLGFRSPFAVSKIDEEWSWVSLYLSYAAAAILFGAMFFFRGREFSFPLRWLGAISYSVYLLHYPTWLTLTWIPHDDFRHGLLFIGAVIVATCIVSSITFLLIEQPAIYLGKWLLRRPKPATELGPVEVVQASNGPVSIILDD